MPILASSMFPNAYGKVGGVAVTTGANPLDSVANTEDVFVVKYNSFGKSVWAARITSIDIDIGYSVVTDTSGNVYVTGQGGSASRVVAFNADGSAFGAPLSNSGNNDAFIVKYNTSGVVQWLARIASTGSDIGYGIATDSSGNVYVTGQGGGNAVVSAFNADGSAFGTTIANSGSSDTFIVKYNTSGVVQWVAKVASTGADIGYSIATDSSGNVYVTGQGGSGVAFSAFNANGTTFGTPTPNSGSNDAVIVKYNTDGAVQWVAKVASTAIDRGYGIVTDTGGNVYVTGQGGGATVSAFNADGSAFGTTLANSGSGDAFIVKYNTNGVVQWVAKVASGGADIGLGIATDSSGNVYVTGQGGSGTLSAFNADTTTFANTLTISGGNDAFIVKYNTSGAVQWVAKVASTGVDIGYGIATDSSGNVYITGQGGSDVTVSAFNANGTAFGTTLASSGGNDAFIVKYNTSGNVQWITRLASTGTDISRGVSIDQTGDLYLVGSFIGGRVSIYGQSISLFSTISNSGSNDAFIVKYNTNGVPQWTARIASTGSDIGYSIATDSSDNIYVTGIYGGGGVPVAILNADGSVFANLSNSGNTDVFVVKYNSNGIGQWAARIGSTGFDSGLSIATDSSGNVYVTGSGGSATVTVFNTNGTSFGTLANSGGGDAFVVKYNTSGAVQWIAKVASTGGTEDGNGIATDTSGNVYITGSTTGSVTPFNADGTGFGTSLSNSGGSDAFVVKYNTSGVVQWVARVASTLDDDGYGIATDSSGNVYITGSGGSATVTVFNADGSTFGTLANTGGGDAFIIKYNTNGVVQWAARIASSAADIGLGIATDSSGNVYVTGQGGSATVTVFNANGTSFGTLANAGGGDAFVVKYNTSGVVQWITRVGSTVNSDSANSIRTDSTGNIYFVVSNVSLFTAFNSDSSQFVSGNVSSGAVILKYDTNGFGIWAQMIRSDSTSPINGISVDSLGNPSIIGGSGSGNSIQVYNVDGTPYKILNSSSFSNAFVVKYSSNMTPLWAAKIGSSASGADIGYGIAADSSGNVYITGQGGSDVTVSAFNADGSAFGTSLSNSGGSDAFVVKYNTSGVVQWVARVATTATDIGFGMATDSSGNVYVTGRGGSGTVSVFNADGSAFGTTLTNTGGGDTFIVKYNTSGVVQWVAKVASTGADIGYGIATDSSGNVYVTGQGGSGTVSAFNANGTTFANTLPNAGLGDAFIVKYNTDGAVQWTARVATSTGADIGYGIATDSSGNVYVTGQGGSGTVSAFNADGTTFGTIVNTGSGDAFIVKYNTSGVVQWLAKVASTAADIGFGIATDSSGNVYVTGQGGTGVTVSAFNADGSAFGTTILNSGSNDAFIVKYNTSGVVQWVARVATTGADRGYGIVTDSGGNVYITGQGGSDVTVTAFNADRTAFGSVIINTSGTLADTFTVKYDSSGVVQWISMLSGYSTDQGRGITIDSSANIYTTGSFSTSALIPFDA